jgi:Ribbon-helix-helix domain
MKKAKQGPEPRAKYSLYIDADDLERLRAYEKAVGVPVSETIRRAIKAHLDALKKA